MEVFHHTLWSRFKAQAKRKSIVHVFLTEDFPHCHGAAKRGQPGAREPISTNRLPQVCCSVCATEMSTSGSMGLLYIYAVITHTHTHTRTHAHTHAHTHTHMRLCTRKEICVFESLTDAMHTVYCVYIFGLSTCSIVLMWVR